MDVLRGFVLLGILVMNIQSFAMPIAAYVNPTAYGDLTGANLTVPFGTIILLPIYMQNVLGLDVLSTGLLLLPGGLIHSTHQPTR